MRFLDFLILVLLLVAILFGAYIIWINLPIKTQEFKTDNIDGKILNVYTNGTQFYPNMRYPDKIISYSIAESCDSMKEKNIVDAFSILSENTILSFNQIQSNGEIDILCSDIAPEPQDEKHFVAGEGGPKEIYASGQYYVIISGKVSLYRYEKCDEPKIALHEILHALGFDHNGNSKSILYHVTNCDEKLDQYIIDEINRLYSVKSAPDLVISNVRAEKTGRYLSFTVEITNSGLIDANDVNLRLYAGDEIIKEFEFQVISIGNKKEMKASNVVIPRDTDKITFQAYLTDEGDELSFENNWAELNIVKE